MPTTSQTLKEEQTRSIKDAVRNWDLDSESALSVVAFPFTSRRLPREARTQKS